MPQYESVFIARQDISPAQVEGLIELFEKVIADGGGSVAKRENWGLRTLAYKIKKNRKGHYVLLNIDAPSPALHEMERQMRINEDILRYLSIRVDQFEDGPSPIMRNKDRSDRPHQSREPKQDMENNRKSTEAAIENKTLPLESTVADNDPIGDDS